MCARPLTRLTNKRRQYFFTVIISKAIKWNGLDFSSSNAATRKDLLVGADVKKNILREACKEEEREQAVKREKSDDNRFKAGEKEIRQGARDSDLREV